VVTCTQRRDGAARLPGWLQDSARHQAGRTSRSVLLAGSGIGKVAQPAGPAALTIITANPARAGGPEPVHDGSIEAAAITALITDEAAELPEGVGDGRGLRS